MGRDSALRLLDEASEAVRYNRDLLQSALDHVGQGLAVFDKKMQLICWNRQFREILILPSSNIAGSECRSMRSSVSWRSTLSEYTAVEEFVTDRIIKYQITMESFRERSIEGRVLYRSASTR